MRGPSWAPINPLRGSFFHAAAHTHDRTAYGVHEQQFRRLLLQLCGNEVIHAIGALLTEVHERTMRHVTADIATPHWQGEHFASGVAAKHRLVKLMADGEAAKAERAWRAYLTVYWRRVAAHAYDLALDGLDGDIGDRPDRPDPEAPEAPAARAQGGRASPARPGASSAFLCRTGTWGAPSPPRWQL